MRVVLPVRKYHVGLHPRLQFFHPKLQFGSFSREETVMKLREPHIRRHSTIEKRSGREPRLDSALARSAQHTPMDVHVNTRSYPTKQCPAGSDLYVVGMGPEAEDRQMLARLGKA